MDRGAWQTAVHGVAKSQTLQSTHARNFSGTSPLGNHWDSQGPGRAPSQQAGSQACWAESPQGLPRSTWTLHLLLHSTTTTSLLQHLRFWLELPPSPQRINPWPALPLSRSTFHCFLELGRLPRPSVKKLLISFLVLVQKKVLPLRWIFPHSFPQRPEQTLKGTVNDFLLV